MRRVVCTRRDVRRGRRVTKNHRILHARSPSLRRRRRDRRPYWRPRLLIVASARVQARRRRAAREAAFRSPLPRVLPVDLSESMR